MTAPAGDVEGQQEDYKQFHATVSAYSGTEECFEQCAKLLLNYSCQLNTDKGRRYIREWLAGDSSSGGCQDRQTAFTTLIENTQTEDCFEMFCCALFARTNRRWLTSPDLLESYKDILVCAHLVSHLILCF